MWVSKIISEWQWHFLTVYTWWTCRVEVSSISYKHFLQSWDVITVGRCFSWLMKYIDYFSGYRCCCSLTLSTGLGLLLGDQTTSIVVHMTHIHPLQKGYQMRSNATENILKTRLWKSTPLQRIWEIERKMCSTYTYKSAEYIFHNKTDHRTSSGEIRHVRKTGSLSFKGTVSRDSLSLVFLTKCFLRINAETQFPI